MLCTSSSIVLFFFFILLPVSRQSRYISLFYHVFFYVLLTCFSDTCFISLSDQCCYFLVILCFLFSSLLLLLTVNRFCSYFCKALSLSRHVFLGLVSLDLWPNFHFVIFPVVSFIASLSFSYHVLLSFL